MGEVSVPGLHRCADDDPCGQIVNGESAPCRLLIEESLNQKRRPALLRELTALMASPDYQRRVLGTRPEVANSDASISEPTLRGSTDNQSKFASVIGLPRGR